MIPQEIKLLHMLSNNDVTFFIPPYQRNYEWSDEQCAVFLEDIRKTYESNNAGKHAEHFFGSITYFATEAAFGQPNKLVLIDGQQRITTTMLFLVAMRDILGDEGLGPGNVAYHPVVLARADAGRKHHHVVVALEPRLHHGGEVTALVARLVDGDAQRCQSGQVHEQVVDEVAEPRVEVASDDGAQRYAVDAA